jgi:hypothetical protein
MIASNRSLRRLFIAVIFLTSAEMFASSASAQSRSGRGVASVSGSPSQRPDYGDSRILVDQARVARADAGQRSSRRSSMLQAVAYDEALTEVPMPPLDGSLVGSGIQQAGFLDVAACGPACDCPSCGIEAGCGLEMGCGAEVGCGAEIGCGTELACGAEVGCGVGAFMEHLGPGTASCGVDASCDSGPVCGVESVCGVEPGVCRGCDGGCDACCDVQSFPVFFPFLRINWCRFDFFAGVQGFTGPSNYANTGGTRRDGMGSFGFYEGFNEGRSLRRWLNWDLASQLGARFTQNNLNDSSFTTDNRNQVFVTAGLFRRVDYGLQYGTVIDYLNDDWYYRANLLQSRSELSWKTQGCHVLGGQYFTALRDDTVESQATADNGTIVRSVETLESRDQYRIFYRRLLNGSGQWDFFGGWTDASDTIVGSTLVMPLRQRLALSAGATVVLPKESSGPSAYENEAWNVSVGLVYRPGGAQGCGPYCRPMFDVADNGSLVGRRK